ncbi:hypothetical protein MRX96_003811 [Rhipicephalus microplus]
MLLPTAPMSARQNRATAARTSPIIPQQSRPPDGNDAPQARHVPAPPSFDVRASSERVITAALAVFTLVPTEKGQREGGTDIGAARSSAKRAAARSSGPRARLEEAAPSIASIRHSGEPCREGR